MRSGPREKGRTMNVSAKIMTGVLIGVTIIYCELIYKIGEHEGELHAIQYVREKVEEMFPTK